MRRAIVAVLAALALALPGSPAPAAEAAVNGFARASAAYVPFNVNPNVDFWPVYSLSETDGSFSHGISGGFWPGFLFDATFFQFGYQPFERAMFGIAESAHPIAPLEDEAGTTDFANICEAGERSKVPLPAGGGDAGAPERLLTGCKALYTQYRDRVPYAALSARTASDALRSNGSALGAQVRFGTISIGHAYSSSYTDASSGKRADSGATVVLSDVVVAGTLRFKAIVSTVRAIADGTPRGAVTQHSLTFIDATVNGQRVIVDERGVHLPDGSSLNDELAKRGVEVRVVDGSGRKAATSAQASSGALVVRMLHESNADAFGGSAERCKQFTDTQPSPVATVQQTVAPNPLYSPRPPYDQLPSHVAVDESVLPQIPCPLLLMERTVDTGVAIAGATAAARFQPLPGGGGFDFGGGGSSGGGFDFGGGSNGGGFGSLPGPLLPGYEDVPPVPLPRITRPAAAGLGIAVAKNVRILYGGLVALLGVLVAGRRAFRYLTRL